MWSCQQRLVSELLVGERVTEVVGVGLEIVLEVIRAAAASSSAR